ncbi:MAG: hypothetical protein KDJ70_07125 [Candidatus Competibacteraceae bacterium]|nr:hypothetical protein [Candidatus Competibacteraceae bacterium]
MIRGSQEIARSLKRGESVFLLASADRGRALVEEATRMGGLNVHTAACVDLEDPATETRLGLLRTLAVAAGCDARSISSEHDLQDFSALLKQRHPSLIVLTHFERAAGRYDADLYATLAFLVSDVRALRLLLQADRGIHAIDAHASARWVFLKTIVDEGAAPADCEIR